MVYIIPLEEFDVIGYHNGFDAKTRNFGPFTLNLKNDQINFNPRQHVMYTMWHLDVEYRLSIGGIVNVIGV